MNRLINWKLLINGKEAVNLENVSCTYTNEYLVFNEESVQNHIDFNNNKYKREAKEYIMVIDFNNKTGYFKFDTNEECTIDIDCQMNINNDKISIHYEFDEEPKDILIELKEEIQ